MSQRSIRYVIGLSGIMGTILLIIYFSVGLTVGLAQLPPNASLDQVLHIATRYHMLWFVGAWLQATGSLLSVVFFLGLVVRAKATARLCGMLVMLGVSTLLTVVLIEGVFTMDLAQAAANGHQITSLTSFDLMTIFTHIYPIVPAPLTFLALGATILESDVVARVFGIAALVLGVVFAIVGLVSLFILPWLTIAVLALQPIWVIGAAISFMKRSPRTGE